MKIILFLSIMTVVATVFSGVYLYKNGNQGKSLSKYLFSNLAVYVPLMLAAFAIIVPDMVEAAVTGGLGSGEGMGLIGAALSTGLACVGAGYAVGNIGSAALGAVSEDPKILGKTLIFVGLGEGIAIYGLIITIMILGRF